MTPEERAKKQEKLISGTSDEWYAANDRLLLDGREQHPQPRRLRRRRAAVGTRRVGGAQRRQQRRQHRLRRPAAIDLALKDADAVLDAGEALALLLARAPSSSR